MTRVSSWLHAYCLSTCAFMISKVHVPGHGLRGVSLGQLSGLSGGRGGGAACRAAVAWCSLMTGLFPVA